MLLGVALHASLGFFPSPWPVRDPQQSGLLWLLFLAIHGFRMPLFFIVSGYFTLMVCQKRGITPFLKQRAARILLPCLLGLLTIVPATRWISAVARRTPAAPAVATSLAQAVRFGDQAGIDRFITVAEERNRPDPELGITPLAWAVLRAEEPLVRRLLETGADPNGANRDGNRPLHASAFAGRDDLVALLLARGADPAKRNGRGEPPMVSSAAPWETTRFIYEAIGLPPPSPETLEAGRVAVQRQLAAAVGARQVAGDNVAAAGSIANSPTADRVPTDRVSATGNYAGEGGRGAAAERSMGAGEKSGAPTVARAGEREQSELPTRTGRSSIAGRYWAWMHGPTWQVNLGRWTFHLFDASVFLHLWFLWFLWWYAVAFALVWVAARRWLAKVPARGMAWVLIALTPCAMWWMGGGEGVYLGPDTSIGWLPFPHLFVFYGLFYAYGVAMYAREAAAASLAAPSVSWASRWFWPVQLSLAMVFVFPLCVIFAGRRDMALAAHFAYVWLVSLGLIGACRALLSRERPLIRYLSDASYWLYLAHLPLVIGLQAFARTWPLGPLAKFAAINAIAVPLLLLSYHFVVRRSWLGRLLNGPKRFVVDGAPRVQSSE
jgi:peptidoglycan/LPS O-acetylase OafA/YrhL